MASSLTLISTQFDYAKIAELANLNNAATACACLGPVLRKLVAGSEPTDPPAKKRKRSSQYTSDVLWTRRSNHDTATDGAKASKKAVASGKTTVQDGEAMADDEEELSGRHVKVSKKNGDLKVGDKGLATG